MAPLATCAHPADDLPQGALVTGVNVDVVATGLHRPVFLTAPQGTDRLRVVERLGGVPSVGTHGHGELCGLPRNGSVYRLVDGAEQGRRPPS